ncbi:GNAT family N-acetyltransferase [Serratia marcescens]|uniref:GNAT family N-acetyltransferase n=1 Tax=Serratia marcescens TaxID=615 RepID=UPI001F24485F|nr:GNAT family N-acetyltransferase [Serratia marcescens]
MDIEAIQRFLSLPDRAAAERLARHGLCFGLYRKRHQLGFARMVTDYATFASVSELFVSAEYRGVGLGSWLARCCLAHPALRGLRVTLPALQAPWRADCAAHAPRALH